MARFPGTIAGAGVLTGASASPTDTASALHAEYAEAAERVARIAAGLDAAPPPLACGGCPTIDAMFEVERRIMAEPTQSLPMLALRLMATFCIYQRCEDDNTCSLAALRQMRDEAAALAGLNVVDEWAAVDRLRAATPLYSGAGCSPAIANLLAKLRAQQAEAARLTPPLYRPADDGGQYAAQEAACEAARGRADATLNALVATPSETPADLLLKVALLHGEQADFALSAWETWAATLADESRRLGRIAA